jgi:hypothetical protein
MPEAYGCGKPAPCCSPISVWAVGQRSLSRTSSRGDLIEETTCEAAYLVSLMDQHVFILRAIRIGLCYKSRFVHSYPKELSLCKPCRSCDLPSAMSIQLGELWSEKSARARTRVSLTSLLARADETANREGMFEASAQRGILSTVVILVAILGGQAPTPRQGVTTSLGIVY